MTTRDILVRANKVKAAASMLGAAEKNEALLAMADRLVADADAILAANALDVEAAEGSISEVMIDRLRLDKKRIEGMSDGIRQVAALPDPVGIFSSKTFMSSGFVIYVSYTL